MRIGWLVVIAPPGRVEAQWCETAKRAKALWPHLTRPLSIHEDSPKAFEERLRERERWP